MVESTQQQEPESLAARFAKAKQKKAGPPKQASRQTMDEIMEEAKERRKKDLHERGLLQKK